MPRIQLTHRVMAAGARRRRWFRSPLRWCALLGCGMVVTPLPAQVVRGTVTERVSGRPLTGVLVGAANATAGGALRSGDTTYVLTNARGEYSLRLPGPGAYALNYKRIGVARHLEPDVRLGAGESRQIDVSLEPLAAHLPTADVVATNLCLGRPEQLGAIVALWDEARTVLRASEVTQRDQRITAWLTKYQRSLDPKSLRILDDHRSVAEGRYDRPMRSASGQFLARVGFWGATSNDTLVFHGPDASALLSDAFHQGYCFTHVQGRGDRRGLHGIEFRPRRGTEVGGISGTMWLDLLSFELRFVEFRYMGLRTNPASPDLGGEVHFARHESGGWLVQRWHIRMPQFRYVERASLVNGRREVMQVGLLHRILEEGGSLYSHELASWEAPGSVQGTITDSTGRGPLAGATVSLSGTPFSTVADSLGRFHFDSIIPGPYVLLAADEGYASLSQIAADHPLNIEAGRTYTARLRAFSTGTLRENLCATQTFDPKDAVLQLLAIDADSGHALGSLRLWLRWPDPEGRRLPDSSGVDASTRAIRALNDRSGAGQPLLGVQHMTDANGVATFCGIPAETQLELVMLRSDDNEMVTDGARFVRVTTLTLNAGTLSARTIQVKRPR